MANLGGCGGLSALGCGVCDYHASRRCAEVVVTVTHILFEKRQVVLKWRLCGRRQGKMEKTEEETRRKGQRIDRVWTTSDTPGQRTPLGRLYPLTVQPRSRTTVYFQVRLHKPLELLRSKYYRPCAFDSPL